MCGFSQEQGRWPSKNHMLLLYIIDIHTSNSMQECDSDTNKCDYKDISGKLGTRLQGLINLGKSCHPTIMNILTHDEPTKDPNFPDLGELVTLLTGFRVSRGLQK